MAELLTETDFFEKRQSAKTHKEKLKIQEEYAKSKAKVNILEESNLKITKWSSM